MCYGTPTNGPKHITLVISVFCDGIRIFDSLNSTKTNDTRIENEVN